MIGLATLTDFERHSEKRTLAIEGKVLEFAVWLVKVSVLWALSQWTFLLSWHSRHFSWVWDIQTFFLVCNSLSIFQSFTNPFCEVQLSLHSQCSLVRAYTWELKAHINKAQKANTPNWTQLCCITPCNPLRLQISLALFQGRTLLSSTP